MVALQRPQFYDIRICKSTNIYVDPSSSSLVELGTKDHPYKNLVLAFIELLNVYSHTNRTVNVYVKENLELPVLVGYMYAINVNAVNLMTYTDSGTVSRQSTIVFKLDGVPLMSMKTKFNIFANTNLNLTVQAAGSTLTSKERTDLQAKNVGIMVNRCDFTVDNLAFHTQFTSTLQPFTFIKAVYLQTKKVTITNSVIKVAGYLFETFDPLNMVVQNVEIDYFKASRGFYISSSCNYAGASLMNTVSFSNITAYNSQKRTRDIQNSFLYFAGPANYSIADSDIKVFGTEATGYSPVLFTSAADCNPNDTATQVFRIDRNKFTLLHQETEPVFTKLKIDISSNYIRNLEIHLLENTFTNILNSSQVLYEFYGTSNTKLYSSGLSLTNSNFITSVLYISRTKYVSITNFSFRNINQFGRGLLRLINVELAEINGFTVDNCTEASEETHFYLEHTASSGYLNITGFNFLNTNPKNRKVISTLVASFKLLNSVFDTVVVYSENSLIKTGVLSELGMGSISFNKISSQVEGDNTNILLSFDSFEVQPDKNLTMSNITISDCVLAFFKLDKISNPSNAVKIFTMSGVEFKNSNFSDRNNLIMFNKMELNSSFAIALLNIKFTYISFIREGNLLYFGQQISTQVTIAGLDITNTKNAYIYSIAGNPQNTLMPVKVQISGLTTSNVNAGPKSFVNVYEGSVLTITESTIKNVFSFADGAFLTAGYRNAIAEVKNSLLQYNAGINGGVFMVENDSTIKVTNCTIADNFGVISGVIKAHNNGIFEIKQSRIFSNRALAVPISQIFDVTFTPVISNCEIYSNAFIAKESIITALDSSINCGGICWFDIEYKSFLKNNLALLEQSPSDFILQTISSTLSITDKTVIWGQRDIIDAFVSTVSISNSTIRNCILDGVSLQITASTLNFETMLVSNITTGTASSPLIQVSLDSHLYLNNTTYEKSTTPLFNVLASTGNIRYLTVKDTTIPTYLLKFEQTTNATLSNWVLHRIAVTLAIPVVFSDAYIHSIENMDFNDAYLIFFQILRSRVNLMRNITILNSKAGPLYIQYSQIGLITNSRFENSGWTLASIAAIYAQNSNLTITNTIFKSNKGTNGGGLQLLCGGVAV